ncbi:MAG: hypothetical protein ABGZ17_23560 [Planctomycetaceae bacterium]
MAAGLRRLCDDPDLRLRLGTAAREQVLTHSTWREHTRRIMERLGALCPSEACETRAA